MTNEPFRVDRCGSGSPRKSLEGEDAQKKQKQLASLLDALCQAQER